MFSLIETQIVTDESISRDAYIYQLVYTHIFLLLFSRAGLEVMISQWQWAHLMLTTWFLIPFSNKKNQIFFLRKMTDASARIEIDRVWLKCLLVPESRGSARRRRRRTMERRQKQEEEETNKQNTHIQLWVCKGA